MRKKLFGTFVRCVRNLRDINFDPYNLEKDELIKVSTYCQEIAQRAIELQQLAQTVHKEAETRLETLQKVAIKFLKDGTYNKNTLYGNIHILSIDRGSVPEDRIKQIQTLHGIPLLVALLGITRTEFTRMRNNFFDVLMSSICEITTVDAAVMQVRELDEFLRTPGKTYLEIQSEIERYAVRRKAENNGAHVTISNQHNNASKRGLDEDLGAVSLYGLKRRRVEGMGFQEILDKTSRSVNGDKISEDIESAQDETNQPKAFLEAAFKIRKDQYLKIIDESGGDGLLGFSSDTQTNATILVPIPRPGAKDLPDMLGLPMVESYPAPSKSTTAHQPEAALHPGPIFLAFTDQSSVF